MNDLAIEELTRIKIKEHFKKEKKVLKMTLEDLIQFSINLIKTIERYKKNVYKYNIILYNKY